MVKVFDKIYVEKLFASESRLRRPRDLKNNLQYPTTKEHIATRSDSVNDRTGTMKQLTQCRMQMVKTAQ